VRVSRRQAALRSCARIDRGGLISSVAFRDWDARVERALNPLQQAAQRREPNVFVLD
jgi:hypothetical protein